MYASRFAFGVAAFGLLSALFAGAITPASADDNCRRLEVLSQQYEGVALTLDQQRLKHRLVVWYESNCRERRTADAK
jgi:hypothetical protein